MVILFMYIMHYYGYVIMIVLASFIITIPNTILQPLLYIVIFSSESYHS